MKQLLITIAAVVLVGCGESQQSFTAPEAKPVEPVAEATQTKPPTAEAPDVSIHDAAKAGDIEAVKLHIAAGTDVDAYTRLGTPLHVASVQGQKEIAELLISKGAYLDARNLNDFTALNLAVFNGRTEIAELLIDKGADIHKKSKGVPPLHIAAMEGRKEVAKLLINKGVDVHSKCKNGFSPLFFAALEGHKEVVKLLISKGADVNGRSGDATPLNAAAMEGHKEVVELLISKGANVNAKDDKGRNPLHAAAYQGQKESVKLLIANGAEVNAMDNGGETSLDYAIKPENPNASPETAELLRKHGGKTTEELKAERK